MLDIPSCLEEVIHKWCCSMGSAAGAGVAVILWQEPWFYGVMRRDTIISSAGHLEVFDIGGSIATIL
jgi:hypothetical protein